MVHVMLGRHHARMHDGWVFANILMCLRYRRVWIDDVPTIVALRACYRLRVLLCFHTAILKPDFDLALAQTKIVGDFKTSTPS